MGQVTSLVGVTLGIALDAASDAATLTLSGPAGGWFGAGLHAMVMADQPYTIVVAGEEVFEQKLGARGEWGLCSCGDTSATRLGRVP